MLRKELIRRVALNLKNLDKYIPFFLKLDPSQIPDLLNTLRKDHELENDLLGDFIQDRVIDKYRVVKKRPELKEPILKFVKENRIRGIHF